MDWVTFGTTLVVTLLSGRPLSHFVTAYKIKKDFQRETIQDYFASFDKQIELAEKRNDTEETTRLRRDYEQQLEARRSQQDLNLVAPKEISREPTALSEQELQQLRELLSSSASVRAAALSVEEHFLRGNAYYEIEEYD